MTNALRPELLPTTDELVALRQVAIGERPADAIIRGGRVLAVHTGEFLDRDVVISGRHIAAITPHGHFDSATIIDATGKHVVPTFIDAHLHIEYTMLTPGELARLSIPRGTTTVLTDADCMANVNGLAGLDFMMETGTPLRIFEQITPVTPVNPALERGGAVIANADMLDRLSADSTATLGESNPFDYSVEATDRFREALVRGRRITGHSARMDNEPLWGYLAAGVGDDHNAATIDEVLDRVRLGTMITVMSGSMNDNTDAIFSDLERITPALNHLCFCADDKHVYDLGVEGHIDHHVRKAIAAGVAPAQAYRMATWQPALYYRLDHLVGAVTPGRLADLQIIDDLAEVRPEMVIVGGAVVAVHGEALFENTDEVPEWTRETMKVIDDFSASALSVSAEGTTAWVQAMEMYDGYFKRAFHVELDVVNGEVQPDLERDVLKIAVIDRHYGDGLAGVGFVKGFTLRSGAIAASSNCTNANIVVAGTSDAEIIAAVHALREQRGGFVVVDGDAVVASVPLPVGGMMSDAPWEETSALLEAAHRAVTDLGCSIHSPFMIMSFVGLGGVPDLGLTEMGLIDSARQEFAEVVLATETTPSGDTRVLCRCVTHDKPVHRLARGNQG